MEAIFLLHRIPNILDNGIQHILIKPLEWNMIFFPFFYSCGIC